jgi:hypothetical protein
LVFILWGILYCILYYKDKENEPWLAKEIARAISQSLKQRTIWHKGLNACMYITSDMKVGHPWTKELLRHQSLNVVFTGHFVWGGEAIL